MAPPKPFRKFGNDFTIQGGHQITCEIDKKTLELDCNATLPDQRFRMIGNLGKYKGLYMGFNDIVMHVGNEAVTAKFYRRIQCGRETSNKEILGWLSCAKY